MRRLPIAAVRKNLAEIIASSAKGERIKLTRYNRSLVGIVPKGDLAKLQRCEEEKATAAPPRARRRRVKGP